jgi:uncharacterized membrane protein
MGYTFTYLFAGIILLLLVYLTYKFEGLFKHNKNVSEDEISESEKESWKHKLSYAKGFVYFGIILTIVAILLIFYTQIEGTVYEGHLREWMNIVIRLMHITFGIAWIGASFYFVFLENSLNRTKGLRDELAGNLWAVHGGGFYYLEKYKTAPKVIPSDLHWFKYEAYFTWLSGFALLFVVYYFNAKAFLIDKNVLDISPLTGVAIGVGSFIVAWIIYDLICKTTLLKKGLWLAILGFLIATGFAWFYSQVFSGRAAYIHFGAMLGTLMAGNVFFVIIPAQKAMVNAAKKGLPLDPNLGKNAGLRSLHNNYFTLPVLFVMISNHFPSTFGNEYQWAVLAAITLGSAGVKHYLNLKEKGQLSVMVLPISVLILLAVAFVTAPQLNTDECKSEVSFVQIYPIITERCTTCHSSKPTDDVWTAPPNGVVYDTPEDIVKLTDKIMQRVVITKTMPQNNKTGMTPDERDLIRCWIEQGASLK